MNEQMAAFLGQGINIGAEIAQTKQQRKWQLADYERQKADQREFWDITNKYNSPEEQMNRLRQAGLNPNLVYGKGADVTASSLSGPTMGNAPKANIKFDYNQIMQAKAMNQQLKYSQAQTDNVLQDTQNKQVQNDLTQAQINQTNVQTANIAQNTATSEFQLQQSQELKDTVLERAKAELESVKIKNVVALGEYELAQIKSASDQTQAIQNIAESKQRILTSQLQNATLPLQQEKIRMELKQIDSILQTQDLDRKIKNIELELRNKGINPNDPYYFRTVWSALQGDNYTARPYEIYQSEKIKAENKKGYQIPGN